MKKEKKTAMVPEAEQTTLENVPEFIQDTAPMQPLKVEVLDMDKLSNRLDSATTFIRKEVGSVAKSFCRIGHKLWQVREEKLYLGQGYKNVAEYGEKVLGFQKSSTANYIAVCERFSVHKDNKPTAQLMPGFSSFSYTQLSLMLPMPDDQLETITPETSCKEIREIKRSIKRQESGELSDGEGTAISQSREICPPIVIFERVLTSENMPIVIKLLRENVGRELYISVEDNGHVGGDVDEI